MVGKNRLDDGIFRNFLISNGLFIDREALRPSYVPDFLPHREQEITTLASIWAPALRGESPSNVFIYGKTGTGKTAVVKFVGKELVGKGKETGVKISFIYINCEIVDTQYRLLQNITNHFINDWSERVPFTGWPTDEVFSKFKKIIDKSNTIVLVVLDEIDRLKGDEALYNLSRINSDLENAKLSLVGISNNLRFTDFLDPRVKSSLGEENLVFVPYDTDQLRDILNQRVGIALKQDSIEDEAVTLCANIAAQEHGDARRALDLLRMAAEIAERNGSQKISQQDVLNGLDRIEQDRVTKVVRSLPTQSKIILFSILSLENLNEKHNLKSIVTTGEVYEVYKGLCKKNGLVTLTQRRVADLISEMDMLGIITARVISKGRYGRTREIKSSLTSSEIINILKQEEVFRNLKINKVYGQTQII